MEQQAGATQLCLDVQSATLLPGCHKMQDVRVRGQALVVSSFPHTPVPLALAPEAMSRALHCILPAVHIVLYLKNTEIAMVLSPFSQSPNDNLSQENVASTEILISIVGSLIEKQQYRCSGIRDVYNKNTRNGK